MTVTDTPAWEAEYRTAGAEETQALAERLGGILRRGDLLLLTGELGAGKTTFTQGLGAGLGVRPGIISPTFVLVREHPNLGSGPDLIHVDAYRLGSEGEVDDIDLEASMDRSVTVVEWGRGLVEHLSDSRLEITLIRAVGGQSAPGSADTPGGNSTPDQEPRAGTIPATDFSTDFSAEDTDEERTIHLAGYGPRWQQAPDLG
ncbi:MULTISPECIES: tRNA (adenosine(37)-N6)-threonylcarbamoyltransferase complex ATPase subunit type 1 TsaE [unclassified Arthrobacter]|uniref:tRNA (adenosine(37)-N6)-threonylcarbamoyltransferase complex ATPase subunit type 1 TsaE n=1 Tax=unclassified Arthrobacter TaxID=235627 RepID=UPI0024E0280B|nr:MULTISPECIES: tRNA (adenosine(37)-N6)-threonylcarbamoyltransferase complex ATPase subunit type 1 TsaE [unclassified Arthrobacter]MCC9144935.1 tRNA (adenosine(37)-N6)-threonylcarbamoyltransferase complex ATPase subunit type 1 TsaE [Arthrobacter sp. zg-Y919]MDK1276163.1 tRNA (adenosine(37)-N6)-threonylcarbamoyltransferase complex ATPase subunit type 1 TsaE [Arthrobacter sp. zg.Y919]WIB02496.1 tRNA (adenosine(37)-N6)-threonylcarbamoyltransferase complex ATPase subunit type 1 TsaE [Arthrobacter s